VHRGKPSGCAPLRVMSAKDDAFAASRLRRIHRTKLAASTPRAVLFAYGDGSVLIHPDCANAGGWRLTRFEPTEEGIRPTGHTECPTWERVVDQLQFYSVDFASIRDVSPSTV
jgi:hypothetical protein